MENLSRDREQEYFVDGMTDELTTDLSKISALRVVSRTSAMHYKNTDKTLPEIARELNVDGVVEGSVMRSGHRVRISAQLIHAKTDQHLWAETYERDLDDVLRLQSEVAQTIAQQVRVQLSPAQKARLASAPRVDPAAYDWFLQARAYFEWGSNSREGFTKAQKLFPRRDRKGSQACARLCRPRRQLHLYGLATLGASIGGICARHAGTPQSARTGSKSGRGPQFAGMAELALRLELSRGGKRIQIWA